MAVKDIPEAILAFDTNKVKQLTQAELDAGLRVKTVVGGAPVTEKFANQIGADGYSEDAPGAVNLIRRLVAA